MKYEIRASVFTGSLAGNYGVETLRVAECDDEAGALKLAAAYVGRSYEITPSTCFPGRTVGLVLAAHVRPTKER